MAIKNEGNEVFDTQLEQQLAMIDISVTEPFVEEALNKARIYNQLFREQTPTEEEIIEAITELDNEWGNIPSYKIKVSGQLTMPARLEDDTLETSYHDDLEVICSGFVIVSGLDGDEPVQVGLQFYKSALELAYENATENDVIGATAKVDEIILDIPVASKERVIAWLTTSYPVFMDELDARLFSLNGNEADALMMLKGIEVPKELRDDTFAMGCLLAYLDFVIQLDGDLPYVVDINGYGAVEQENEFKMAFIDVIRGLASIAFVNFTKPENFDDGGLMEDINLGITVYSREHQGELHDVVLPLSALQAMTPVREFFQRSH